MWTLKNGQTVIDRNSSHLSPGVSRHIREALLKIDPKGSPYMREVVDFDQVIGKDLLVVTKLGDDVFYAKRKHRHGHTRFVRKREPEDCSSMVVIIKQAEAEGERGYVLITAFIASMISPPEPWDTKNLVSPDDREASEIFWANCALVEVPEMDILPDTITGQCPW